MILTVSWSVTLFIEAILLGVALAMDAFSVTLANTFNDPLMGKKRQFFISSMFGFFQALMPMIGWVCVHFLAEKFKVFSDYVVPPLAFLALGFIGGKMIIEYFKNKNSEDEKENGEKNQRSFYVMILLQAIATSIDALSVGLTTAKYDVYQALVTSIIIAVVTFGICLFGTFIGKKVGTKIGKKAELVGGIILVCIGIIIFSKGMINIFAPDILPSFLK